MRGCISCLLAPAAFVLDRISKLAAAKALQPGVRVDVLPGLLRFVYVENTGAAFSMLSGRQALLIAVSCITLVGLLIFLLVRGKKLAPLPRAALWLLFGGAAGNLFDRIFYGAVIDFIEFAFIQFPVFNVADCCIVLATALLMIAVLTEEKKHA